MKENADKYIILLLLMGTSILYLTKADLASVIQMLMFAVAISITDSLYRLNNKIWNIALIVINTIMLSVSYEIVPKKLRIFDIIIYSISSVIFCLAARFEKIREHTYI
ncbi:hypothetical protein [Lutispora sp.]|uniref:hypothetical protein n=1 Tax=Lutispora sp. TaxID=2828727 RepID=UPI002B21A9A1|nr:hypothetical protein [Lutispora sp.]MEA4960550.1 hypothetical protein [Lutispora sp.]